MAEDSEPNTVFTCYMGLYQYQFGFKNVPATFMSRLFSRKIADYFQ